MSVIYRDFTKKDRKYLLGKGEGYGHGKEYLEGVEEAGYNVYKLDETAYIIIPVAKDWLEFREVKTGNLISDFEWWLYKARARYGIYPCDLEIIKEKDYTYEDIKRHGESIESGKYDFYLELDSVVRDHLLKMNNFFDKYHMIEEE